MRFDFQIPAPYLVHVGWAIPIWVAAKSLSFYAARQDRESWRYVSLGDLPRIVIGNLAGSLVAMAAILEIGPPGFPRSIYLLDLILSLLGTTGARIVFRAASEHRTSVRRDSPCRNTLIYGAGDAGVMLLKELRKNPRLSYRVLGFLDDQPNQRGRYIQGIPILGCGEEAISLVREHRIDVILIAIPSATSAQMTRVLESCRAAGVDCRTVPGLGDIIKGVGLAGQMREVAVEDLLGRKPVRLDVDRIRAAIHGKVVLVTGAAGSIGFELCRQIATFEPAAIVGFEIAESPLFEVDREMRRAFPEVPFYPEIGSVQNRFRVDEVMGLHRPSIVYHAAAYKHVPLMEAHIFEAVENNVFGTWNVALAAAKYGAESFVLISSDKAVRPSSIMGVTKRVAETLLRGLHMNGTKYVGVRFGNVLGSAGSVIPIFRKQILAGGPVTVTHPEMRRFFMTIPEACQLVLQASVIAESGQICMLDMGEQIKIVDLARMLILLSGMTPDRDIGIAFTGVRPGEKLSEEVSTILENTIPSRHEKVHIYVGAGLPASEIFEKVEELHAICESRDAGRLVSALQEIVRDYTPSPHLLERVPQSREQSVVS